MSFLLTAKYQSCKKEARSTLSAETPFTMLLNDREDTSEYDRTVLERVEILVLL